MKTTLKRAEDRQTAGDESSMGLPPSTLSNGLVPSSLPSKGSHSGFESERQPMGRPTTLGKDLVPQTAANVGGLAKRPPKSHMDVQSLTIAAPAAPAEAQDEMQTSPPKQYQERVHLSRAAARAGRSEAGGALPWEPAVGGRSPIAYETAPRRCVYTGDDLAPQPVGGKPVPKHRDEAWRFGVGLKPGTARPTPLPPATDTLIARVDAAAAAPRQERCVFTGDDLPRPSTATATQPEALRRLSQWKTRLVMPERLEGVDGFGALRQHHANPPAKAEDAQWAEEKAYREMIDGFDARDAQKRRGEVDLLIADKQVNAYGERLPTRARGDLLSPWAPREELGVQWRR